MHYWMKIRVDGGYCTQLKMAQQASLAAPVGEPISVIDVDPDWVGDCVWVDGEGAWNGSGCRKDAANGGFSRERPSRHLRVGWAGSQQWYRPGPSHRHDYR